MARIVYSSNALANLQRIARSLRDNDAPEAAIAAVARIRSGIDLLQHHPLIGRLVAAEIRELVISYGRTGYLALYRYIPGRDLVRVLALRHQRELDYPE